VGGTRRHRQPRDNWPCSQRNSRLIGNRRPYQVIAKLSTSFDVSRATQTREGLKFARVGQVGRAFATVNQALAIGDRGSERWYVAELLRIEGELLLQEATAQSLSAAEDCFVGALDAAREQGALFWELRAAMSLARLRVRQDRHDDARQVLAPVYDQFH
jgi:predicted ATPase